MPRIQPLTNPTGQSAELLENLRKNVGKDLNIFTTMAHSPAALKSYMDFSGNLKNGALDGQTLEIIALTCAGYNKCNYCASAHSVMAEKAGLNKDQIKHALNGSCDCNDQSKAVVNFTKSLLKNHGQVNDQDVQSVQDAGFNQQQIIEMIAATSLNIFTNYFNEVAQTEIDFPKVETCNDETCGCKNAA